MTRKKHATITLQHDGVQRRRNAGYLAPEGSPLATQPGKVAIWIDTRALPEGAPVPATIEIHVPTA